MDFHQGYPQELGHFISCVREDKEPLVTGEDGRAVLEMIYGAYLSAKTGAKVSLPLENPPKVDYAIQILLGK